MSCSEVPVTHCPSHELTKKFGPGSTVEEKKLKRKALIKYFKLVPPIQKFSKRSNLEMDEFR